MKLTISKMDKIFPIRLDWRSHSRVFSLNEARQVAVAFKEAVKYLEGKSSPPLLGR